VRTGGNGWGRRIELTSGPYSSVEERKGVRVLAGCWNWAMQAENEGEGREMDFFFFLFFFNLFSKVFTNLNFEQNFILHKFTHHKN
jgi:hypothetical protein